MQICLDGVTILADFLALVMLNLGKEYFAYNTSTPTSPPSQAPTAQPILLLLLACKSLYDTKNSCLGSQTRLMVIRVEDNEPSFC